MSFRLGQKSGTPGRSSALPSGVGVVRLENGDDRVEVHALVECRAAVLEILAADGAAGVRDIEGRRVAFKRIAHGPVGDACAQGLDLAIGAQADEQPALGALLVGIGAKGDALHGKAALEGEAGCRQRLFMGVEHCGPCGVDPAGHGQRHQPFGLIEPVAAIPRLDVGAGQHFERTLRLGVKACALGIEDQDIGQRSPVFGADLGQLRKIAAKRISCKCIGGLFHHRSGANRDDGRIARAIGAHQIGPLRCHGRAAFGNRAILCPCRSGVREKSDQRRSAESSSPH